MPPPLPFPRPVPPPLPTRAASPPPLPTSRGATPPPLPNRGPTPPPLPGTNTQPPQPGNANDNQERLPYNAPKIVFADGREGPAPPFTRYTRLASRGTGVILNRWTSVQSTWLWAIKYEPYPTDKPVMSHEQMGDMTIEFVNGFIGLWPSTTLDSYRMYVHTFSKGKLHYRVPWKSKYTTIRAQTYYGAALEARIRQNT